MRTQQEIDRQVEGLKKERASLPEYSMFGDPNHAIIDAQIEILRGDKMLTDFDEGDWDELDETNKIYSGAEDAENWLNGTGDEYDDLFSE